MENKSWIIGVIVVLVIALIAVSTVMWSNKKQVDEAEDFARRIIAAEQAKKANSATPASTTPGTPAAPAPSAP